MGIAGALMCATNGAVEGLIGKDIANIYHNILVSKESATTEYLYCICFFDDLLEYCSEDVSHMLHLYD